jgi:hypothetical protein
VPARDAIEDLLDHQHPLRPAKAAEGRVRRQIRFRHLPAKFRMRNEVGVVEVEQRAVGHGLREIE